MFDSYYDAYRGVISSVRVFNGVLRSGAKLRYLNARQDHDAEEIGVRLPAMTPVASLGPGEVGYLIAGIKDVGEAKVGETVTDSGRRAEPLEGYRDPKPMVFCGLYPVDGDEYADLREAMERLRLNDSSFTYEPETSGALGFGFRCGFLGLLHMEIIRERLEREYDLSLVATAPNVEYRVQRPDGSVEVVDNPSSMPPPEQIEAIEEPFVTRHDPHADRVRRHAHGARAAAARRDAEDGVPVDRSRRARVHAAARRDRARLLRPDEVAHARLREPRLRTGRLPRRRTSRRSTCCSTACPSTRSRRSCTAPRPTCTAAR